MFTLTIYIVLFTHNLNDKGSPKVLYIIPTVLLYRILTGYPAKHEIKILIQHT